MIARDVVANVPTHANSQSTTFSAVQFSSPLAHPLAHPLALIWLCSLFLLSRPPFWSIDWTRYSSRAVELIASLMAKQGQARLARSMPASVGVQVLKPAILPRPPSLGPTSSSSPSKQAAVLTHPTLLPVALSHSSTLWISLVSLPPC